MNRNIFNFQIIGMMAVSSAFGEICTLDVVCPSLDGGTFECVKDVPPPAENQMQFEALAGSGVPFASIFDFCGELKITSTDMTGSGSGCLGFPFTLIRKYTVMDDNDMVMCTRTFIIDDLCLESQGCKDIHLSLANNCEAEVIPAMVLHGAYLGCPDDYIITLTDHYGDPVPNPLNETYVGQKITYHISNPIENFFCWGEILLEDKQMPTLDCAPDLTVYCFDLPIYVGPEAMDNCDDDPEVRLIDEETEDYDCNPDYLGKTTRTYVAIDKYGNFSEECEQEIHIRRLNPQIPDNICWPPDYVMTEGTALDCSEDCDISITGVPQTGSGLSMSGMKLDLFPLPNNNCNIGITMEDIQVSKKNCKIRTTRLWTIYEWFCGEEIKTTHVQVIEKVDTTGPEFDCNIQDTTLTTEATECYVKYLLPEIPVSDNCNEVKEVDVFYPGGFLPDQNGGEEVNIPIGNHTIKYIAYDDCHNSSTCEFNVTVEDNTQPLVICNGPMIIGLNGLPDITVNAQYFDNSSSDGCGIDHFEVARMNDNCGIMGNTEFGDHVVFCCNDVGAEVMVLLRVYDIYGNFNQCMIPVILQDKIAPDIMCDNPKDIDLNMMPEITVDAAEFDDGSADACGIDHFEVARTSDNCGEQDNTDFGPSVVFCCDDIGEAVDVWLRVFDENGNFDQCLIPVTVTNGNCLPGLTARISGHVYNESNERIENAEVYLKGLESSKHTTQKNGFYDFGEKEQGEEYVLQVEKGDHPLNGVSTLDLVLIQKQILGLEDLKSVYKKVAADANNSGEITASDVVELRRIILGKQDDFTQNKSWRFLWADYKFSDSKNPWIDGLPEKYQIPSLNRDMNIDFIGLKTGDVNGDVSMDFSNTVESRIKRKIQIVANLHKVDRTLIVDLVPQFTDKVYGMQIALKHAGIQFIDIIDGVINMTSSHFADVEDEVLNLSWSHSLGVDVKKERPLFSIVFQDEMEGIQLEDLLEVQENAYLMPEIYLGEELENYTIEIIPNIEYNPGFDEFAINQNIPNPWKTETSIDINMPEEGIVQMRIFDIHGAVIMKNSWGFTKGENSVHLDREAIPNPGVYFVEIQYSSFVESLKMIVLD